MRVLMLLKMSESGSASRRPSCSRRWTRRSRRSTRRLTIIDTNGLLPTAVAAPGSSSPAAGHRAGRAVHRVARAGRRVRDRRGRHLRSRPSRRPGRSSQVHERPLAGLGGRGRGAPDHGPGRAAGRLTLALPPSARWDRAGGGSTGGGQRGLAARGGPAGRRADPDDAGPRAGRGPRPGRAGRGPGAVAGAGRARQPGRLAHGRVQAPRDRPLPPGRAAPCAGAVARPGGGRCPISTPPSTTSRTTCCG